MFVCVCVCVCACVCVFVCGMCEREREREREILYVCKYVCIYGAYGNEWCIYEGMMSAFMRRAIGMRECKYVYMHPYTYIHTHVRISKWYTYI